MPDATQLFLMCDIFKQPMLFRRRRRWRINYYRKTDDDDDDVHDDDDGNLVCALNWKTHFKPYSGEARAYICMMHDSLESWWILAFDCRSDSKRMNNAV